MSRGSGIEWTDDTCHQHVGCTDCGRGCANCFAKRETRREMWPWWEGVTEGPEWSGLINLAPDENWKWPLDVKTPRRIFVNPYSDTFHEDIPAEWNRALFEMIDGCQQHQFQVLTKRPHLVVKMMARIGRKEMPPNVWLGTSVEDRRVVKRIDHLRAVPARIRFLSIEPLIGPIGEIDLTGIHWVIAGGESGDGRMKWESEIDVQTSERAIRRCDPAWVREVRDQCIAVKVPFFFKQWGRAENNPLISKGPFGLSPDERATLHDLDPEAKGGATLDGRLWREFPRNERKRAVSHDVERVN